MPQHMLLILSIPLLYACSTQHYQPEDFSIYDKHIRDFVVSGDINVESINMQESPIVIYDGLVDFQTTYSAIADSLAKQLKREITENSTVDGTLDKKLYVQVDKLYFLPGGNGRVFDMDITLMGDRGFEKHFRFKSHRISNTKGGIQRSFDKAIAESVRKILSNSHVLKYLVAKE